MADTALKGCVREVRDYAQSLGFHLTQSQGYELVARARGYHSGIVLAVQHTTAAVDTQTRSTGIQDLQAQPNMLSPQKLQELHIVQLGDSMLSRELLYKNGYRLDVIMPLRKGDEMCSEHASQFLLGNPAALSDYEAHRVDYPYGKNYEAYRVTAQVYRYPSLKLANKVQASHYPDLSSELKRNASVVVAFGYNELDWQVGKVASFRDTRFQGWTSSGPLLSIKSLSSTREVVIHDTEFDTLEYLGGPHFQVTEGEYEGLVLAFYFVGSNCLTDTR